MATKKPKKAKVKAKKVTSKSLPPGMARKAASASEKRHARLRNI